jgi:hypothetical protein
VQALGELGRREAARIGRQQRDEDARRHARHARLLEVGGEALDEAGDRGLVACAVGRLAAAGRCPRTAGGRGPLGPRALRNIHDFLNLV